MSNLIHQLIIDIQMQFSEPDYHLLLINNKGFWKDILFLCVELDQTVSNLIHQLIIDIEIKAVYSKQFSEPDYNFTH